MELGFWGEAILNNAAAWGATYLLHSTILLGTTLIAVRRLSLAPSVENALWRVALTLAPLTTTARIAAEHVQGTAGTGPTALAVAGATGTMLITSVVAATVVATLLTGRLGRAAFRERARLADRTELTKGPELRVLDALARRAGEPTPRLSVSPSIAGPIAIGDREICLPAGGLRDLDADVMRAVLAHELGHLTRRDPRWITIATVLERVFFLQPLQRIARARLRETAEFVADEYAVHQLGSPEPLVRGLTALARGSNHPQAATAFGPGSLLMRRVRRALGIEDRGTLIPRWNRAMAMAALVATAWTVPAIVPAYDCRITGAAPAVAAWILLHL